MVIIINSNQGWSILANILWSLVFISSFSLFILPIFSIISL